jgi:hypothetical protein
MNIAKIELDKKNRIIATMGKDLATMDKIIAEYKRKYGELN